MWGLLLGAESSLDSVLDSRAESVPAFDGDIAELGFADVDSADSATSRVRLTSYPYSTPLFLASLYLARKQGLDLLA